MALRGLAGAASKRGWVEDMTLLLGVANAIVDGACRAALARTLERTRAHLAMYGHEQATLYGQAVLIVKEE
jgi:hypothetical protein